jgi:hypothetical protein
MWCFIHLTYSLDEGIDVTFIDPSGPAMRVPATACRLDLVCYRVRASLNVTPLPDFLETDAKFAVHHVQPVQLVTARYREGAPSAVLKPFLCAV